MFQNPFKLNLQHCINTFYKSIKKALLERKAGIHMRKYKVYCPTLFCSSCEPEVLRRGAF